MLKILSLSLFAVSLFAQNATTLDAAQVKICPAGVNAIVVVMGSPVKLPGAGSVSTQTICAQIDASAFKLDTTTTPPTLRLLATPAPAPVFVDGEVPGGAIDGVNATFTLVAAPNPAASLQIFKNGLLQTAGASADYVLSGSSITFNTASIPQPGDVLLVLYRH
jgi:hypothetical protein